MVPPSARRRGFVALADANEPEEAAATAERVIALSGAVTSDRTAERVRVVLERLEDYGDIPEVRAVLDGAA
ncbi:hypothetical protein [Streptomyces rimosus]|uniref:hypothetical protein n=1 Tax=Streptomyces rimosus TaxID=1927 RepID=UPI0005194218|nr:hypothetical protein [Streptomyces rimosus]